MECKRGLLTPPPAPVEEEVKKPVEGEKKPEVVVKKPPKHNYAAD